LVMLHNEHCSLRTAEYQIVKLVSEN